MNKIILIGLMFLTAATVNAAYLRKHSATGCNYISACNSPATIKSSLPPFRFFAKGMFKALFGTK